MKKQKPIYVETFIRSNRDMVWDYTQDSEKHEQWDLRFSHIKYLPRPDESVPQRFLYQTNIGFGLVIKEECTSKRWPVCSCGS
ncbi:hypothetical protein [Aneurinibacillus tyrosinisolvens]|uniref:hypothetical protein n=1 Tax=Aneurinibacillus tyrosinisolvens TaxID=1443435 RepID=UPI00063F410B|nr:hypothetical protein [Aneurinibacillus tyrosinisolvens]